MSPLPKRKISKGRRDRRRSHLALTRPQLTTCPQCHAPKRPHHVCLECGNYRGVQVIEVKDRSKK